MKNITYNSDRLRGFKKGNSMNKIKLALGIIAFNIFAFCSLVNAADLKSVDYSSLQRDKIKITLTFSEQVSEPNIFSIDDPARLVLDFQGVTNKLQQKTIPVELGVIKSISTVEAGGRTRTVINLDKSVAYTVEQSEDKVFLILNSGSQNNNSKQAGSNKNLTEQNVVDIDFRRGEEGEGRLMVYLDKEDTNVNVHQERDTIVVDLVGTAIPEELQRRLDVTDFATPVTTIDSTQHGKSTQLILSTTGAFEHLAYQTDAMLVVELKPITASIEQRGREKVYDGDKLSLNFQNIEVRAVLQLLADFTDLNLVTSDTVQGSLTLRLKNVPWDQALDIILKTKGLGLRQNGTVMFIAPATEIAARNKQELEAQKQLVELEPLYSEIIEINFAKSGEIIGILDGGDGDGEDNSGFLSSRGTVIADERTNSLLIRDTADKLAEIRQLVTDLDVPVRQVLIESRIVIANNDFSKELGVRFGVTGADINRAGTEGAVTSGSLAGTRQVIRGEPLGALESLNVNLPVIAPAGQIGLALAKLPFGGLLELELSAMQQEGHGEVISSPRVITSNQQTAIIQQGTEIPYQEASSSGATAITFKEAVLKLEVTPQITPDDRIIMDLEINKDEVGQVFLGVPSIDTRSIKTQVLVDNGETVVLGGIYEQNTITGVTQVPWFGDLPVVGWLFKTTEDSDKKRELLVFITPKIITDDLGTIDY